MVDTHHVPHHYGPASEDVAMTKAHEERNKICSPGTCPMEWSLMIYLFECNKCGFVTSSAERACELAGIKHVTNA